MDRSQDMEEQVRRLSQTIEDMRGRMARLEGREPDADASKRSDRRGFLRLGAGAVLGALGWAAVKAVPASAATGGNMILGSANLAEATTALAGDSGSPVPVFSAAAQSTTWVAGTTGTFAGPLQGLGTSGSVEGVDGWASTATGYGVYGLTDAGHGVVGESNTGIGLYARRSGRIRQEGLALAGLPAYTPNLFEQVRDANGVLWIHNGSGTWRRVNSVRVDSTDGTTAYKPFRLLDTRGGGARRAAGTFNVVQVSGTGAGASAIPADAVAVVGNLTAVSWTGPGFLTIMPAGTTYNPAVDPSSVNFLTGQVAIANSFTCGLNGAGALQVYVGNSPSHFIVDITAYIQ